MSTAAQLAALYRRDLTRLIQELSEFPSADALWQVVPPVTNSAGNLTLHLEGNLREYIGRQLGNVPYSRKRDQEFSTRGLAREDLVERIEAVRELVPGIVAGLSVEAWEGPYPENGISTPLSTSPLSTGHLLLSLYGHLNYHLGQIDYLRRVLTEGAAIQFARS